MRYPYTSPSLLDEVEQLANAGDIPAAGRKLRKCVRRFLLCELQHFNALPPDSDDFAAPQLAASLATAGECDEICLAVVGEILTTAAKAESCQPVDGEFFRGVLPWARTLLNGSPYLQNEGSSS